MFSTRNRKLIVNILLMFIVYMVPKIFSFLLIPIYTSYLSTEDYGISDLICTTAALIIPFISLATPNAVMCYTIENKTDKRPFQVSLKVSFFGFIFLAFCLVLSFFIFNINKLYLTFLFLNVTLSILTDISLSYTRGIEKMKAVTICGVGGSLSGILCSILFIVCFHWGLLGYLIASISGYIFQLIILSIMNVDKQLLKGIFKIEKTLTKEMLSFSIPLIFSGLSWWALSSADRYFITFMCGAAANGIYSIANKLPLILKSLDNVFGQAWIYTVYDTYKTDDGKQYINKINNLYLFVLCLIGSILISFNMILSKFLYSNEFYLAWKYAPFLILAAVFSSCGGIMSIYISIYKKTKETMIINIAAALLNMLLNFIMIKIFNDALGAAIATAFTFFLSWFANTMIGSKLGGLKSHIGKCLLMFFILILQILIILFTQNTLITSTGIFVIIIINGKNIKFLYKTIYEKMVTFFDSKI